MDADAVDAALLSAPCLPESILLQVFRHLKDEGDLLAVRAGSKKLHELADVVLEEQFKTRWGVTGIVAPPAAAPAYAAAAPQFVICHKLAGRESLAGLAVRYHSDVVELKRLNNMLSDHSLHSRSHLYMPVPDAAAAAAGKRVAFVTDEHSRRRLVVVLGEGEQLPGHLAQAGGSPAGRQRRAGPTPATAAFLVDKLAATMQRALRIDHPTAAFYVQQAGCDLRAAMDKYEEDRRWEKVMRHRGSRLLR